MATLTFKNASRLQGIKGILVPPAQSPEMFAPSIQPGKTFQMERPLSNVPVNVDVTFDDGTTVQCDLKEIDRDLKADLSWVKPEVVPQHGRTSVAQKAAPKRTRLAVTHGR